MMITQPDTELEYEIQELYILTKHWLQDISFAEDELRFFKTLLKKHQTDILTTGQVCEWARFSDTINVQDGHIAELKKAVPAFLGYLEPYVGDLEKAMDLNLLEKYNRLDDEIKRLFEVVRLTKQKLFAFAESLINPDPSH